MRIGKNGFLFYLFFYSFSIYAQSEKNDLDITYGMPQIRVSISTLFCPKAAIQPISGKYHLTSSSQIGFEADINYLLVIERDWSLITGLNIGVLGRNYNINVSGNDFNPPLGYDLDNFGSITEEKDAWFIKIPLKIEKRWWFKHSSRVFHLEIGTFIGFGINPASLGETDFVYYNNGNSVNYLNMELNLNNHGKPWVGLQGTLGYDWMLNNWNSVGIFAGYSYSNSSIVSGTYQINIPGQGVSTGNYRLRDQYLQIGISYQITKAKKKSRNIN